MNDPLFFVAGTAAAAILLLCSAVRLCALSALRGGGGAGKAKVFLFLLAALGAANSASANSPKAVREADVAVCIRQAAKGHKWLERTLWGLRDQEGGWIGAAIANTNGTHDLGPLQVNSWWVPKIAALVKRPEAHVRYWLQNDACFNAEAARWIFLSGLAVTGDYWKAIGVYHSPTARRQARYVKSVALHLRKRYGDAVW
jgi:hypothetical protein